MRAEWYIRVSIADQNIDPQIRELRHMQNARDGDR